jgi:hypothetical protein
MTRKVAGKAEVKRDELDATLRYLNSEADMPDIIKSQAPPVWMAGAAPGVEWMAFARLGELTFYVAKSLEAQHRLGSKVTSRVSWSLLSDKVGTETVGGEATSLKEAKTFAYAAYQAAHGLPIGNDT